jgi:hypothetical protein
MRLHEITVAGDEIYDPDARAWVPRRSPRGLALDQLMQLHRYRVRRAANHGGPVQRGHKRAGNGDGGSTGKRR